MHKDRWPLFRDSFDDEVKKLPAEIQDELRVAARRGGLK
jgi:hypothetical protein